MGRSPALRNGECMNIVIVEKRTKSVAVDPVVEESKKLVFEVAGELELEVSHAKNWTKVARPGASLPRVAVDKRGSRAFLIGLEVTDSPAVEVIGEEQARKEHLGYARGIVDLGHKDAAKVLRAVLEAIKG